MDRDFSCSKIYSTFKHDKLAFPKRGTVKLSNLNQLCIRVRKDVIFADDRRNSYESVVHIVNFK